MLRSWFNLDRGDVGAIGWRCNLLLLQLLLCVRLLLLFQEVAFAPVSPLRVISFRLFYRFALLCSDLLSFLFSLISLVSSNFLILLLRVVVQLTGTLITGLTHFLPHNLAESTIVASVSKSAFRCLQSLLFSLSSESVNWGFFELVLCGGLPLNRVKHIKHLTFTEQAFATWREQVNRVIDFYSFVKHARHQVNTIWCPFNIDCTIRFRLADVIHFFETPKVNLSCQVSKASNHRDLGERTHSDCVTVTLAEFEKWTAVFIIKSSSGWLNARYYDECFAGRNPCNIMNHVVENWNKLTVTTSKYLNIL